MSRVSRAARWGLRIAVSAGIVSYILVDVSKRDLLHAFVHVRVHLVAAALVLYLAGQVLSAFKWALLGRSVGLRGSALDYTRFYFIGMFFNLFGPSTLGGDVVRALYLGGGRRPGMALNSVLFDRLSGLAVLMAVAAVALLVFPQYDFPPLLEATIVVVGLGLVVGWWTCPRLARMLPARSRLRHLVEVELAPFWRDRWLLARVAAISLAFHGSQVGVQYILCRAAGADVSFSYCLIFHPILSVMLALPVSLGGFGVREGGYLYFLTRLDVDDAIAVTTGLLWWVVTVLAGLIGGAFFLSAGARLPRLRARTAEEAA